MGPHVGHVNRSKYWNYDYYKETPWNDKVQEIMINQLIHALGAAATSSCTRGETVLVSPRRVPFITVACRGCVLGAHGLCWFVYTTCAMVTDSCQSRS